MDQEPVKRPPPSAIPRLSRLPLPTAAAPKLVRPSPSRERLQADQGLNVSRLRRPSEDVFKKPHLPPPSSRKVSDNFYAQRRSSQYGHSIRTAASAESLASKRNSELCLTEIGPSLEERTIETLSQIPSSPSPSRRQSGFFRPSSPMRSPSRPTSEISQHPVPQITSPTKQFRPRASLSTDPSRPKPRAASSAPSSRKASENSRKEDPPVPLPKQDVVSPRMPPNAQTYSETNGSAPAKDTPKSKQPKPRKPPSTLSSNITSPTSSVSKTSQRTSVTSESNCSEPPRKVPEAKKASKSSSALRESIAKAKAARKAARQSNANDAFADPSNSISMKDPFNQLQNETSDKALLKSRTRAARKSGHLNIAALGLKEIPHEVMTMYDYDPESTDDWYEAVDLVKFIAADNEFESLSEDAFPDVDVTSLQMDEGCKGNQFGGLEALDLHGNLLASLPIGLRRLQRLRSLNLAKNRLNMDAIEVITQIGNLTELRLGNNDLDGMFTPQLGSLQKLEVLDLRGNALTGLPDNLSDLTGLRVLNVAENQLTSLPFSALSKLPLVEINAQKNRLQGCLVPASIRRIEGLQILNVSASLPLMTELG
ncbi:leucine-rich repeat-containing protein 40 [Coccidioides immitis H538.4]|uniref:Leucine-rich repeat-containing protein 40 n=1 Tax=Coccidioides immitis H538.4 TaxID=396776 RepID=A0A0J8S3E0_COCIT|nr:leucine-rich repeat-containing protein 40 [Coccidioides immitis H538.4]